MESAAIIILLLCCGVLAGTPERGPAKSPSPCGDQEPVEVLGARTLSDGSLQASNGARFPPGCSWISHPPGLSPTTLGCESKVKPCLWQCCPDGQTLNHSFKCEPSDVTVLPIRPSSTDNFNIDKFHILKGFPCSYEHFPTNEPFSISDNGKLMELTNETDVIAPIDAGWFCVEVSENETIVIECGMVMEEDTGSPPPIGIKFILYTICRIIALPFLVATFVVYAVTPELRNLHGKCLMSHLASLIVAYIFQLITQTSAPYLSSWLCITVGFCVYYFMLASFYWLNVMSFDIWWTFRGYRSLMARKNNREMRVFLLYSLYSWGAPFIMLSVALFMQFCEDVSDEYLKPQIGVDYCWFITEQVNFAYFECPVLVLMLINVIFFAVTAYNIYKLKKDSAVLTSSESTRSNLKRDNERFVLYLKLFVVMGVPWFINLIIWASIDGALPPYLVVIGLLNIMQGIPIFFIFVWKPNVRKLLRERWCDKASPTTTSSVSPTASTGVSGNCIPMTEASASGNSTPMAEASASGSSTPMT